SLRSAIEAPSGSGRIALVAADGLVQAEHARRFARIAGVSGRPPRVAPGLLRVVRPTPAVQRPPPRVRLSERLRASRGGAGDLDVRPTGFIRLRREVFCVRPSCRPAIVALIPLASVLAGACS